MPWAMGEASIRVVHKGKARGHDSIRVVHKGEARAMLP